MPQPSASPADTPAATAAPPTTPRGSYVAGTPPTFDENQLKQAGIRRIAGSHLVLYTDLPSRPAIDELVRVFDAAVPMWCEYFGIDANRTDNWQLVGCLMKSGEPFAAAGLLPPQLPKFEHGYQWGWQLWCYDKPSDYYRRHLLLHEGTHAFMAHFLGGAGPPWYMEGMAELLALHEWVGGTLKLNVMPESADAVPLWGRVRVVRRAVRAGQWVRIHEVFAYGPTAHRSVDAYAFSWAACWFLSQHPRYAVAFAQLRDFVRDPRRFEQFVATAFPATDSVLQEDWHVFLNELDYGCDVQGAVVHRRDPQPLPAEGATARVRADQGWQSTGYLIEPGRNYHVSVGGQITVRAGQPPWLAEPPGITIHYFRGRPLGMVMGAVRPEPLPFGLLTPLVTPIPIGTGRDLAPETRSVLFLRVNEYCGDLADNDGFFEVRIEPK